MQITAEARFAKLSTVSWLKRKSSAVRMQKETDTIWCARRLRAPTGAAEQPTVSELRALFIAECVQKGWGINGTGAGGQNDCTNMI